MLSFLAEKERRGKVLVRKNARNKGGVVNVLEKVITMNIGNKPPDNSEQKPRDDDLIDHS